MASKQIFINEVLALTGDNPEGVFSKEALEFWNILNVEEVTKPAFTENGKMILAFMQKNKEEFNNIFKAKDIGERISLTSRGVSGSLRKLVTDGYVEKIGSNPIIYTITSKGEETNLEEF